MGYLLNLYKPIVYTMKNIFLFSLLAIVLSSCLKNNETEPVTSIDPPFEKYKFFWTEVEKKEGAGNWTPISGKNVLRLYTDIADTASRMYGQYEYNASNAKLSIPDSYFFLRSKDSIYFYRPVNANAVDPSKYVVDTLATVGYQLLNDSVMVISNKATNPVIEVKYVKQ